MKIMTHSNIKMCEQKNVNLTWNDLDDTWKKVFNDAIGKGKVTTAPNQEELKRIMNLQKLYCSGNKITDLSPLKNLTQLQVLYCKGNDISEWQIQAFKEQHPNCRVRY